MQFRIICIGKTREANLRALIADYETRLGRFVRCETTELRDGAGSEGSQDESRRILGALRPGSVAVALDPSGREWDSHELAAQVENWQMSAAKEVAFIIGGPTGLAEEVMTRANIHWSLSRLTLTHEMARLLLVEQLYRAFTIIRGLPYQK
jgi:23S rRNA (pseudouridine1915-N3)-methyltransferase